MSINNEKNGSTFKKKKKKFKKREINEWLETSILVLGEGGPTIYKLGILSFNQANFSLVFASA